MDVHACLFQPLLGFCFQFLLGLADPFQSLLGRGEFRRKFIACVPSAEASIFFLIGGEEAEGQIVVGGFLDAS